MVFERLLGTRLFFVFFVLSYFRAFVLSCFRDSFSACLAPTCQDRGSLDHTKCFDERFEVEYYAWRYSQKLLLTGFGRAML
jgi:hypothetical protein